MSQARVLVVDDEAEMRELLRLYLENEHYAVDEAASGREALRKLDDGEYQLLLIDLMMPEMDGWTLCGEVRQKSGVPIIIVTARGEEFNRVMGFELGADDYVTKPFSPKELVARVRAILRRTGQAGQNEQAGLVFPDFEMNHPAREVIARGQRLILTPKEYDLLHFLAGHPGQVFTREFLLDRVWGYSFAGGLRTVDTHVKNLRSKLAEAGAERQYITTVWGVGYKFEVAP